MKRAKSRQNEVHVLRRESPSQVAGQAGYGPKITVENGFLVLRWSREHTEAIDSAGMSPEELLRTHLIPRLEATKTICLKHRGQITQKYQRSDWSVRFDAVKLMLKLWAYIQKRNAKRWIP